MTEDQKFEQFIELCKRIFERLEREDSWPWEEQDPEGKDRDDDY